MDIPQEAQREFEAEQAVRQLDNQSMTSHGGGFSGYAGSAYRKKMLLMEKCPICGPKLSVFCMIMSGWGIIFLALLGICFFIESSQLYTSVPAVNFTEFNVSSWKTWNTPKGRQHWQTMVQENYKHSAYNCFIAAALFAVTLVASFWQNKWKGSR